MFLSLVLALATLDILSVTVRNAIALFFAGWVKLGGEGGGFEAIGQNLLGTAGSLLLLILLLIIPPRSPAVCCSPCTRCRAR